MRVLKIAVIGAGHLGRIHIKCIGEVPNLDLVGFYDPDQERGRIIEEEFNVKYYSNFEELLALCEAVDIVTPTIYHHAMALKCLNAGKHVFIEKPIAANVSEAEEIVQLGIEKNLLIQVGHVERFNPAFQAINNTPLNPMFIEAHRLATFNPRGTDVSVVLDLMIHDLDLVLAMVNSPISNVYATGVSLISKTSDISNVRLEFENGAVANLTASRLSINPMRKLRLFQTDAYISMDFLDKKAQIVRLYESEPEGRSGQLMEFDTQIGKRFLEIEMPESPEVNAIRDELAAFVNSIINNEPSKVSGQDGLNALRLAYQIMDAIDQHHEKTKLFN